MWRQHWSWVQKNGKELTIKKVKKGPSRQREQKVQKSCGRKEPGVLLAFVEKWACLEPSQVGKNGMRFDLTGQQGPDLAGPYRPWPGGGFIQIFRKFFFKYSSKLHPCTLIDRTWGEGVCIISGVEALRASACFAIFSSPSAPVTCSALHGDSPFNLGLMMTKTEPQLIPEGFIA